MDTTVVFLLIVLIAIVITFILVYRSEKIRINSLSKNFKLKETELLVIKKELGTEKQKLATILDTICIGIIILDSEQQVTMLNKTAEALFQVTAENAIGCHFINISRDHEMDNLVQRCLQINQPQTGVIHPIGNKQYLDLIVSPLNSGILVLVQDITKIRRLEKVRQDFVVNISHELRTPIASCKAIVETLQNGAISNKNVADDFLQRMHVEIDKLAQMVDELSELSRIESGELTLKLEPMEIASVITRVSKRLKAQADRARIVINLEIPKDLPNVIGDFNMIEQVLVNLVHNAIKFTLHNGQVTISAKTQDNTVQISVQDTGIGIPEDDLPHIFERFYKVDKAHSGSGTGLGLAIVKHIIQAHGSDIRTESELGKGSKFIFCLPIATS